MTVTILRGDARALPLADDSVDLIVTSPPYWGQRSYQDGGEHYDEQIGAEATPSEYVDALIESTREWMRVLKSSGSLWVNLGDSYYSGKGAPGSIDAKSAGRTARRTQPSPLDRSGLGIPRKSLVGVPWRYALACIDDLGLCLRAEVVWSKPNGMPESVNDRVRRSHETWLHFTLQPQYYSNMAAIREPYTGDRALSRRVKHPGAGKHEQRAAWSGSPIGRLPGSVWDIATTPLRVPDSLGVDHFAAFPIEWPRRIITGWCPPRGTVLDPFGGTGTTALAASVLDRHGITVDLSADYCRLAAWRTTDPVERARAMGVPPPPARLPGEVPLFALTGEASRDG